MNKTKVYFKELQNFSQSDEQRANGILPLIEFAINSDRFREELLKAPLKDTRFRTSDGNILEVTDNQKIYELVKAGREVHSNEPEDFEWDLRIELYRSLTWEVGHTEQDIIYTKKRKFRKFDPDFVAAHWIHEYCHVAGFIHDYHDTEDRDFSVPYVVGEIAETILEENNL